MKKLIAISLISLSFSARADVCQLSGGNFESAVRINGLPGYFFKVHPDGKSIAFIESGNQYIDLTTGSQHRFQGGVDPVWSPDGAILTHPGDDDKGMTLYHGDAAIAAALKGKPEEAPKVSDPRLQGVYQSIGKSGDTYSVITDQGGASIAQYQIVEGVITPMGQSGRLCNNITNFPSDLPMLSRDSKYLSVYDSTTRSTKIYNVNGMSCDLAVDLGFPTGKVSFNMDSSQITFHMDQFGEFDDGWFSGISKDKVKNVVAVKLTRDGNRLIPGDWSLVSKASTIGDGGYYPDYDAEGNIHYLEDRANFFQFVKVRQNQLEWYPYDSQLLRVSGDCTECAKRQEKNGLEILAGLWSNVCSESGVDMKLSPIHAATIDPAACTSLVNDFWTPALNVTKEKLLESCPKRGQESGKIVGEWDLNRQINGEKLFNSRCLMCHSSDLDAVVEKKFTIETGPDDAVPGESFKIVDPIPAFELDAIDSRSIERMNSSIYMGTMPRGSVFTQDERSQVADFLDRKLVDHGDDYTETWEPRIRRYTATHLTKEIETQLASNPNASQAVKESTIRRLNCTHGGINCEAYLVEYESTLSGESKEKDLMRTKCEVMVGGVTPQICHDWYLKQSEKKKE
jgi:hypothetical protein